MAPAAHDFESTAACAAMIASIRRGLLVGFVIVAAVAVVVPVVGRHPRVAASATPATPATPAASRPAPVGVPKANLVPADALSAPDVMDEIR